MTTFNQAMLAKDRVLAIRVGNYTSNNIKEADFAYGYVSGDTYKPGGTIAGSASITFTSIITTFKKLDTLRPEIGLQVDGTFEWVKMGVYYVSDIEIDRNKNQTRLKLTDGMFKLNGKYVTDLIFPAQIRDVIKEIATKTGIALATDDFGLRAIQHHIQRKPSKKDITFREVLSQVIQLLGFSAFFNRAGKLEIRGLTESGLTITADNYFLHGLTKSELEYQISGITCKKDKETLTVGLRTGRSLELENEFMIQNILDDLYHQLKDITYYPYSLDYQGHLKLDVGQWITLVTNKGERYKVPVLSQSFTFKGGLKAKISADSKSGNDTQYTYGNFLTKRIEQRATQIEAEVQQQLEWAEQEFIQKEEQFKAEVQNGIEKAKDAAELFKNQLSEKIDQTVEEAKSELVKTFADDISSRLQDVVKLSEIAITDSSVTLGAGKVVDGQTMVSLLTTQPESITAITKKLIITTNELNLVRPNYKNLFTFRVKDVWVTDDMVGILKSEDEFLITCHWAERNVTSQTVSTLQIGLKVRYSDGTVGHYFKPLLSQTGRISVTFSMDVLESGKRVEQYQFFIRQPADRDFSTWSISYLTILKKSNADLIVDGSITSRHILSGSIETGALKAGAVTSVILASEAVTADKLKVDSALISKLMADDALVKSLTAKQAFITSVQSIEVSATKIKGGLISSINGETTFNLQTGRLDINSDNSAIRRVVSGRPTQFIKFQNDSLGGITRTTIGSNRGGNENDTDGNFVGIRMFNGKRPSGNKSAYGTDVQDVIDVVGDVISFTHSIADGRGWRMITHQDAKSEVTLEPFNWNDTRGHNIYANNLYLRKNSVKTASVSLLEVLKQLSLIAAHIKNGGFSPSAQQSIAAVANTISGYGLF